MQVSKDGHGRPIDRAAMIEAASRSLRQQMQFGRTRDRPRSKGSNYDMHASVLTGATGSDPRSNGDVAPRESRSSENAQRRIRSAENEHRVKVPLALSTEGATEGATRLIEGAAASPLSQPSSALDHYPVEDESAQHPGFDHVSQFEDIRRPYSRKKDPSASAAAGLGAFSSPTKLTDAFEQRKTRQPIPVESWGPRPPSRGGIQSKATPLDAAPLQDDRRNPMASPASSTRNDASMSSGVGGTWAAARHVPVRQPVGRQPAGRQSAPDRGRERKAKDRGSPEELGVFGSSTTFTGRSQSSQQLTHPRAFEHSHQDNDPLTRPGSFATSSFGQGAGPWASRVDMGGGALEVSGLSLADTTPPWPSSPAGSASCGSPPTRRGSRPSEMVCVEDAEADSDLGVHANSYRRDAIPAQVIITRSTQQKKDRTDARRSGRDDRTRDRGKSMPFDTGLDPDFLSLFAS